MFNWVLLIPEKGIPCPRMVICSPLRRPYLQFEKESTSFCGIIIFENLFVFTSNTFKETASEMMILLLLLFFILLTYYFIIDVSFSLNIHTCRPKNLNCPSLHLL